MRLLVCCCNSLVKKPSVASHNYPSWSQPMFRGTNEPTHMGGRDDAPNSSWLMDLQTQSNKKYARQWLANDLAFLVSNGQWKDLRRVCFRRPAVQFERSSPSPCHIAHHTTMHTHNVPILFIISCTISQISTPPLSTVSDGMSQFSPPSASMADSNCNPPLLQACRVENIRRRIISHLSNHDLLQPFAKPPSPSSLSRMAASRLQKSFPTSNKRP